MVTHLPWRYADRAQAGRVLGGVLREWLARSGAHPGGHQGGEPRAGGPPVPDAGSRVVVLGLPRGGVPVAAAVAGQLGARLDVFVVRKLGVPWQPELAMGAVASGGVRVLNEDVVRRLGISREQLALVTAAELAELDRRERRYRGARPPLDLAGTTTIVVDDGLATGATARAALKAARRLGPARVLLAVPVAPAEPLAALAGVADAVVCPRVPRPFEAVGQWYDDFRPTTDEDVAALLR